MATSRVADAGPVAKRDNGYGCKGAIHLLCAVPSNTLQVPIVSSVLPA